MGIVIICLICFMALGIVIPILLLQHTLRESFFADAVRLAKRLTGRE